MKVKILKSAGVVYKNEVMVVQVGKEMDLQKSLANHLIKIKVAERVKEETVEETEESVEEIEESVEEIEESVEEREEA